MGTDIISSEFRKRARNGEYEGLDKEKEGEWNGSFMFIQGADCQYGMIDDMAEKTPIRWEEEIKMTRIAIDKINQMKPKPKFFAVCGDLVHAFPGEEGRTEQEQDFAREFSRLDPSIPLVCCCGNHDVGNKPTPQSIQRFRDTIGDDYFSFWAGGVKCLVLNSQYYEDSSLVTEMSEKQNEWLDRELNGQGCKHLITFQHIPWFLKHPDEGNDYFNIDRNVRSKMLEKLHKAGVKTVFCGHYHRNAGGFYKGMEEVVTSAMGCPLGTEKSGLRVVTVTESGINHKYYAMDDIPLSFELD
ncbi:serine/threonine-protein phosphatase CPPED1-like [Apostichopus japonicus]|uniref:serine/threonine-protein phosphatase CPPED1-like n=1 Tax=Stichopus japonicus TaxID=307972 RepID=UPI003AB4B7F3